MSTRVRTTYSAYFMKYRPSVIFQDYIKRQDDLGFPRVILGSKEIETLNNEFLVKIYLSDNPQKDAFIWSIASERNGTISGIIEDLEQTGEKAIFLGNEHQIRFWEKAFLSSGIRVLRYEANQHLDCEKICYIAKPNRVIPIEEPFCLM